MDLTYIKGMIDDSVAKCIIDLLSRCCELQCSLDQTDTEVGRLNEEIKHLKDRISKLEGGG